MWQLRGMEDQAALDAIFRRHDDDSGFWSPEFSPEHCDKRLKHPKPLLIIGTEPLEKFGAEERRANYLDSSIWCRYASSEQEAEKIRAQFARNRELGLYDCNNGKEHLEFWARMLVNSRFGEFEGSGHGKIVPTVFPSEGEMARQTEDLVRQLTAEFAARQGDGHPLVWKILLVDDHASTKLSGGNCSKLGLIREELSTLFDVDVCEGNADVPRCSGAPAQAPRPALGGLCRLKMHCVESKDAAKERIKRERFDIIMLDYLLNKPDSNAFEISVDLLVELKKAARQIKDMFGPLNHFWFFNVSAFASAIDSRLTAKGISYHRTDEWWMDKGACPINTPELFRHNLLQFMLEQLHGLTKFPPQNELEGDTRITTLYDLLRTIYCNKNGNPRANAKRYLRALLKFKADSIALRKDIEYGLKNEADKRDPAKLACNASKSEIVYSLFPDIAHYTEAFWDHLTHLVYHTAHGSPQQWPQMMVNFKETKEILRSAAGDNKAGMVELLKAIEGHIIALHDGKGAD